MEPKHPGRNGQQSLWAAQGVLVGLRRYSLDEAFMDIVTSAKRHNVAPLGLADALVVIAQNDPPQNSDDDVVAAARLAWGALLSWPSANSAPAPHLPGTTTGTR